MVREQRESCKQALAFHARPFVLCGLPLRKPPTNQILYTRRNGTFLLEVTAHPRFGPPYGQDRLIPIWLATLALQQKTRMVQFETPAQLLDYFRLRKDGSQYRRMKSAFQRVFAATIFFGTEEHLNKNPVVDWSRFHFVDQMRLWTWLSRTLNKNHPSIRAKTLFPGNRTALRSSSWTLRAPDRNDPAFCIASER